jgi:hypothetical protein
MTLPAVRVPRWFVLFLLSFGSVISGASAQPFTPPVLDPPSGDFLDVSWYHDTLITAVDLWNGGLDG